MAMLRDTSINVRVWLPVDDTSQASANFGTALQFASSGQPFTSSSPNDCTNLLFHL